MAIQISGRAMNQPTPSGAAGLRVKAWHKVGTLVHRSDAVEFLAYDSASTSYPQDGSAALKSN